MAILAVISLPGLVRAQSGAHAAPIILLHPGVATVFHLPDEITDARVHDRGEIRLAVVGDELFVRPRPGTPAGMNASLEVEARTVRWTFQLVVVTRARDARRDVQVPPMDTQAPEESMPEIPPELPAPLASPPGPVAPSPTVTPETAELAASAPTAVADPAPPESTVVPEPATSTAVVPGVLRPARAEISVHAIGALGFTSLDVMGSAPISARQPHLSLGARLAVTRPDSWWSLEASINGEWPVGPMVFVEENATSPVLMLKGPWMRAEVGTRVWVGTKWRPSVYAALGVQLHLRRTETESTSRLPAFSETMPRDVVLVLGIGLQRRAGNLLLGLDFQVREGGPDGYHSTAVLWTMGCYLDPD